MTIEIKKSTKVADFQAAFTKSFPFLKPIFLHESLEDTEGTWSAYAVLNTQTTLGELSDDVPSYTEVIGFTGKSTIAEIENTLLRSYGLSVRIQRKHMNDWVETGNLRHLDLNGHNEMGLAHNHEVDEVIL